MCSDFVKPLLVWYNENARDLPWRHTKNPYCIWVSEIMLQQTRVEAVRHYYERFLTALPSVADLAKCREEYLLKLWEGLGYYSRVRNMQKTAGILMERYGGVFPEDPQTLEKLPGIGTYTAGAIASIAYGKRSPAVDGNVLRILMRLYADRSDVLKESTKKKAAQKILELTSGAELDFGSLNQAFMDLGSLICLPNSEPRCSQCPIAAECLSRAEGLTSCIPVRVKKKQKREENITVFLIRDGEKTVIRPRPEKGLLSSLYEFPNLTGRLTENEALSYVRDCGCEALHISSLPAAKHVFSHIIWYMTAYEIRVTDLKSSEEGWIFADVSEIETKYPIPSAFSAYARTIGLRIGTEARKENV